MTDENTVDVDPEIMAMSAVLKAVKQLEPDAQSRVLGYVAAKLGIALTKTKSVDAAAHKVTDRADEAADSETSEEAEDDADDELQGISPVAKRWIARNGLDQRKLSDLFSLGVDEIDLIAKSIPGKTKKNRMHNVFLLKGVAAYLGSGAYKFTHQQVKEACLHYDALDAGNFATHLKSLSGDVAGNKATGYSLTARGQTNATALVKSLTPKV